MSADSVPSAELDRVARVQKIRKAVLAGIAIFGALVLTTGHSHWKSGTLAHEAIEWVGILLMVIAILGRTWCTLYIGGRKVSTLVDAGPYSVTRNPLYVFSVIGAFGAGAQFGSMLMGVIAAVVVYAIFLMVILREERALKLALGVPYRDYLARVPRFFPNFGLWRDEETLVVQPRRVRITFFDGLFFLAAIPIAEGIEGLQNMGLLPHLFTLP
jgi:protein-S-isoprenylcysteine O-methyltransferase Ste14